MGAEVYFWFAVVFASTNSSAGATTLPIPYQTQYMCKWALAEAGVTGACIPQPAADVAEFSAAQAVGREPEVCEMEVK